MAWVYNKGFLKEHFINVLIKIFEKKHANFFYDDILQGRNEVGYTSYS